MTGVRRHSDFPTLERARRVGAPAGPRALRAFTLIELMVVIAIIAILMSLVLVVGSGVLTNQQAKMTQNVLYTLDRALEEYITAVGGKIPPYGVDPSATNDPTRNIYYHVPGEDNNVQTYGSGTNNKHCARPDASVFIKQTRGFGAVDQVITGLPDRFLRLTIKPGAGPDTVEGDPTPSVVDAWASAGWPTDETNAVTYPIEKQLAIYYVHPDNTLAQDLYGQCKNRRPYFMSAGPDRLYGLTNEPLRDGVDVATAESFVKDNIYSYSVGPIRKDMSSREWNP